MQKQRIKKPDNYQSKKPIQKRSLLTRQKILNASMSLIADIGYEKANTNLIAKKAEISIGTIYIHFKDKSEIFLTILDEFSQRVFDFLTKGIDDVLKKDIELEDALTWLLKGLYKTHQLNGSLNLEIAKFALNNEKAAELMAFWDAKNNMEIVRLLEPYREQLAFEDLEAALVVANCSAQQVFRHLHTNKGKIDKDRIFKEFISMIIRYAIGK